MIKKGGLSIVLFIALISSHFTLSAQRETKTINDGWEFSNSELADNPIIVNLPHTWNTDAYTFRDYKKGRMKYSRYLVLPEKWRNKQLYITFEAASKIAKVYINKQLVGEHRGGYTAFTFDITSYCSFSDKNIIEVEVDNATEDAPPISADFTFFGGIYRDVWLTAVPKQHINLTNMGSKGVFIETPTVSEKEASLIIKTEILNSEVKKKKVELQIRLLNPEGAEVNSLRKQVEIKGLSLESVSQSISSIQFPSLWSPEAPNLYVVEVNLRDAKTKNLLDVVSHNIGFRWFHFDGDKGFFLNGKPYKLRGVCRHQDQEPIGVALSDEMHRRDIRLIKEMGANFIRISHYPQDAAILEICDKLGLLVWEEIPVIDIVPDSEIYAETCELNLREMIRQHYNHPSIILWGYMNEILLVTERRYKGEELKVATDRALNLSNRLEKVLKEEDHYRPSVMAFHGSNKYNEVGFNKIVDVVGWNLYSGWYGGDLNGFNRFVENQNRIYPANPIIISEYGAGSDRRLHSFNSKPFDFSIEYQQKYIEHYLPVIEDNTFISGAAYWNFIDFSSALRNESMPRINNKGLVYADRNPKDVYYYFKALWRNDKPVLHVASRDWTLRAGVQINDEPVLQPIKVYTNLPEVELFINDQSLGKKKTKNCVVVFDVPLISGSHFIRAQGLYNNQAVEDGMKVYFTALPSRLTAKNPVQLELAINVGSNCYFTSDESSLTWLPDQEYELGGWGYVADSLTTEESTQSQIQLTTDNPLFQTLRSNLKGYKFDLPNGRYEVELLFADIFQQSESPVYLLGKESDVRSQQNSFRIVINNDEVEENFCPSKEVGNLKAIKKRYVVQVDDGSIEVEFKTISNKNFLNGIKLTKH